MKPLKYYNIDLPKPLLKIQEGIIRKYFNGFEKYWDGASVSLVPLTRSLLTLIKGLIVDIIATKTEKHERVKFSSDEWKGSEFGNHGRKDMVCLEEI